MRMHSIPQKCFPCEFCGKLCTFQCSRCQRSTYCDKVCFKKAWPGHKKRCVELKQKSLPVDGGELQMSILSLQMMEKANVGNFNGTYVLNEIASFLGLDPKAKITGGIYGQQQQIMVGDRIPLFNAACQGQYDIYVKSTGLKYEDSVTDLADGTIVFVRCRVHLRGGRRSEIDTREFQFHSTGSLAAELYAVCNGRLSEFQYLESGPLFLLGQPELFWSMTFLFREHGTVMPLCRESASSVDNTIFGREIERITNSGMMASIASPGVARSTVRSTSLAVCQSLQSGVGVKALPPLITLQNLPSRCEEIPAWWKSVARFWDGAFYRSGMPRPRESSPYSIYPTAEEEEEIFPKERGTGAGLGSSGVCRPICMFYNTELGCLAKVEAGCQCAGFHDPVYAAEQISIRNIENVFMSSFPPDV